MRISKYEARGKDTQETSKNNLLVKNIDKSVSAKDFCKLFEEFGDVKSCKLEVDSSGESKGYGYVFYNEIDPAENALKKLVFFIIYIFRTEK